VAGFFGMVAVHRFFPSRNNEIAFSMRRAIMEAATALFLRDGKAWAPRPG